VDRLVVQAVLARKVEVPALERANQFPSRPRSRLAEAAGRAYATLAAPPAFLAGLKTAVASDAAAVEAAERGAGSPLPRARAAK
jgi:hypothetical protein